MLAFFLDRQLKILLIVGIICTITVFLLDFRGIQALAEFLLSAILIFAGQKLYQDDTSENWLKFSRAEMLRNIAGIILMFFGWIIFLEGVLALAIASIILKLS